MSAMHQVAALQMVSGDEVGANLSAAGRLIARAAEAGARLVVLPENFAFLGRRETDKLSVAETAGSGPMQGFLADIAARLGIWLVGGTIPLRGGDPGRVRAACLVFGPDGRQLARYDKMHLFDVRVSEHERYEESRTFEPGDAPALFDCAVGRVGLAVCYDLRFPELFRALSAEGAELLAVPSAFTAATGAAHWELLVRARAVENLCYMIAPDQGGEHPNGRRTYGGSMIVDPWGNVLAQRRDGPGVVQAGIDLEQLAAVRRRFPALEHRRPEWMAKGGQV